MSTEEELVQLISYITRAFYHEGLDENTILEVIRQWQQHMVAAEETETA